MSKYEVNVWEYADEFKNLDTNETFYGYQVCELLEQKDQRIAELEAKLAESETKRKSLEEKVKFLTEEKEENFVDGQKYNELKEQLVESEKSKESYRLQNEQHHLQLLQFYSRLGVEAFGADIHEKALETLMIMKEQLAESKNQCQECKHLNKKIELNIKNKLIAENCELQNQLAEKEKEKEY